MKDIQCNKPDVESFRMCVISAANQSISKFKRSILQACLNISATYYHRRKTSSCCTTMAERSVLLQAQQHTCRSHRAVCCGNGGRSLRSDIAADGADGGVVEDEGGRKGHGQTGLQVINNAITR